METWIAITAGTVVLAVGVPLLMRVLNKRDPAQLEQERLEQAAILAELAALLGGISQTVKDGGTVAIGAGSAANDQMTQLRRRIRRVFTLSAASEFDREIGFELSRAGVLQLTPEALDTRIERATRALRNALSG